MRRAGSDARIVWIKPERAGSQRSNSSRFELDVTSSDGVYRYELLLDEWGQPVSYPRVLRESVTLNGKQLFLFEQGTIHLHNDRFEDRVPFAFDPQRSGMAIVEPRPENRNLSWFKEWLGRLLSIQIDPKRMGARADKEAVYPACDLSNFAEWYRHLRLGEGTLTEKLRSAELIIILIPKWQVETWIKRLLGQQVSEDDHDTDRPTVDSAQIKLAAETAFDWARPSAEVGATCVNSLRVALPRWQRIGWHDTLSNDLPFYGILRCPHLQMGKG